MFAVLLSFWKVAAMCNHHHRSHRLSSSIVGVDTDDTVALADPAAVALPLPLSRRRCRAAAAAASSSVCDRLRPERPLRLSAGSPSKWSSPHSGVDSFCVTDTCARAFTEPPHAKPTIRSSFFDYEHALSWFLFLYARSAALEAPFVRHLPEEQQ